jgi:hypothetical protein
MKNNLKNVQDFDELDYYFIDFKNIYQYDDRSFFSISNFLTFENFEKKLKDYNFKHKKIPVSKHLKTKQLLNQKTENEGVISASSPYFNEILIFKSKGQIVCIVRIDFRSSRIHFIRESNSFVGTDQFVDYLSLQTLLKSI